MKRLDVQQHTDEWLDARIGLPTASNFDKIVTTKGEPSKQQKKYLYQIVGERLSGVREEGYKNSHMERGIQLEQEARTFYQLISDSVADPCGFFTDDAGRYGASPDGLVGDDGLIEIKCPSMAVHVGYMVSNSVPTEYFQQIQGQLLVTERKWVDFISYYPGMDPVLVRGERNETFIAKLKTELEKFCKEADALTQTLRKRG